MTKSTSLYLALAACGAAAVFPQDPWPGGPESTRVDITYLDPDMRFQMSGAVWNPDSRNLLVVTDNHNLFRLSCPGHCDLPATWRLENEWSLADDTEAITQADWAAPTVFIGVENSGTWASIREYDLSGSPGGQIAWTREWELVGMGGNPNSGLEALTFVPDDWLAAAGLPQSTFGTGGLFFAGEQASGHIFVVDLDRNIPGNYLPVAELIVENAAGVAETEIAGLEFDRSNGVLYSYHNYDPLADVVNQLALTPVNVPAAPTLASQQSWFGPRIHNNEGIALVPSADCDELGYRRFFLMTDNGFTANSNSVGIYPLFPCDPRPPAPAVEGCVTFQGAPLANQPVLLQQPGEPGQAATTDADGCYAFETAVSGKVFRVGVGGPVVP